MSEFKVIETQEKFDEVIKERIARAERSVHEEYRGFLSPEKVALKYRNYLSPEQEKEKYEGFLSPEEAAQKDAIIKRYETDSVKTRAALENGIPYELAGRLIGETEEDIKNDAKIFARLIKGVRGTPLVKSTESDFV